MTLGIVIGYVVGKPAGIVGASWLATRRVFGGQRLPVSWPGLGGIGAVAGIGFTVSLLISSLAFRGQLLEEAKIGILAGAVLSALSAWAAFRAIARIPASTRARQLSGTADELLDLADDVDPELDHLRGRHDAPVILLEYGDYECPYCGQAETVVRELLDSFGDDLCYVWRHLPLSDVHPRAQMAAEAAEAAGAQGRFWDMHDTLLSHQDELLPMHIRRYAEELGLDLERFVRRRAPPRLRAAHRARRRQRRRERRVGHADLLHQRPPPPGRLRHRDAHRRGARRARRAEHGPVVEAPVDARAQALDVGAVDVDRDRRARRRLRSRSGCPRTDGTMTSTCPGRASTLPTGSRQRSPSTSTAR